MRAIAAALACVAALACALTGCGGSSAQTASTGDVVEDSKITVSVAADPVLHEDGTLDIVFENEGLNGWSQRMELEQDGAVIWTSGTVPAGDRVDSCKPDGEVKAGLATATVYAVDPASGEDHGNPVSVEVTVTDEQGGS